MYIYLSIILLQKLHHKYSISEIHDSNYIYSLLVSSFIRILVFSAVARISVKIYPRYNSI